MDKELTDQNLLNDIRVLVTETKNQIVHTFNQKMTTLYWHVGKRIQEKIIGNLTRYLSVKYGKGFNRRSISYMIQSYMVFSDYEILKALSAKLSWSRFLVPFVMTLKELKGLS